MPNFSKPVDLARSAYFSLLMGAVALTACPAVAEVVIVDRIAAIVDADVVLQSEFDQRLTVVKSALRAADQPMPDEEAVTTQIIERLIVENLQMQVATRAGVRVSDEELNETMRTIAQRNGLTLEAFRQAMENDGVSWIDMRAQVRNEMMISRVQQGVMNTRITVTDQEVDNFLESELGEVVTADEYRLGHILLPILEEDNGDHIREVAAQADALFRQIQEGGDFQTLAVERSAGQHALEGGDLGWRKVVQLPTMFADVAQEMELGEVRGPIKSGSGYHIIKLLQKRGARAEGKVAQTEVRHVLIKPSEIRTDEEARDLALTLREEIVEGRDFAEVAKLHSEDPGSALSGGDLGWNRAGTFVDEFEALVQSSEIDDITPVFETIHGYHFLQVTGRRVGDFSEEFRRNQAHNYLANQKFDEELDGWLRELREDAYVDIRL